VRWAALLHDIGKPDTRVMREGEATFYGHADVGATLADRLLERFRMPNVEREAIVHLVREHMFDYRREWTDAALRRWLRRVGLDAVADLFDLRIADALGTGLDRGGFPSQLEELRERIDRLIASTQALQVRDLAIDGRDVMDALDISPGPRVGAALDALLDVVLERPEMNARELLFEELRRWAARAVSAAPEA
jgi:putative nucleotidyltransferase with HDIG domain